MNPGHEFDITVTTDRLGDIIGWCLAGAEPVAWGTRVAQTYPDHPGVADRLDLLLHRHAHPDRFPFPAPLYEDAVLGVVNAWLIAAERGPRPSTDGSVASGVRLYNTGLSGWDSHIIVVVEPVWIVFGK